MDSKKSDFYLNNTVYGSSSDDLSYRLEWKMDTAEDILMTVAMPLRNMSKISWLAFESLRRQVNPGFSWELIVYDDNASSRAVLDQFVGKLPGCKRVVYKSIFPITDGRPDGKFKGTVPLIDKWVGMAQEASPTSIGYALKSGDDYSPQRMLINHFENFKNKDCIYSTYPKGLFYHIGLKKAVLYDGYGTGNPNEFLHNMHLHMAVRTSAIKLIRPSFAPNEINRKIDGYIRREIAKKLGINVMKKKHIYDVNDIDPDDWKTGINTDGLNTITSRKKVYLDPRSFTKAHDIWQPCDSDMKRLHQYKDIKEILPKNVIDFLLYMSKQKMNTNR